jgi:broad specificity phosphatase PhoE
MREGGFADSGEPLDEGGERKARALVLRPASDVVFSAPSQAAIETAQAMALVALPAPALANIDHGAWRGQSLTDVQAAEPDALMSWIMDPASGAPGGETFASVQARVAAWMESQAASDRRILAITHATIMRAALAHVLDIPAAAAFRIDVAPLSSLTLSFNRQWRFQGLGGEGGPA